MVRNRLSIIFFALVMMAGAFCLRVNAEPLEVPLVEVWQDGDVVSITIADSETGMEYEVSLSDCSPYKEFILVRAKDKNGVVSDAVRIKNPYYNPDAFTPDGVGTVTDNAVSNGKEFFTIMTPDENVFHLVIDRDRDADNVYFLNAVTEEDLLPLAENGGNGISSSAIPSKDPKPTETPPTTEPPVEQPPAEEKDNGAWAMIIIIITAVGGAGYYFKIHKPKTQQTNTDDYNDYDEGGDKDGDEE